MRELETIMEDSIHLEGATIPRTMLIADTLDSPRKQEQVYLLVESQKRSSNPRVQQKVVPPKFKKYVERNITEVRIQLKSLVRRKGSLRMKTKRTSTHSIVWPPRYTTNASEEVVTTVDEGRTRRLNYLYYA